MKQFIRITTLLCALAVWSISSVFAQEGTTWFGDSADGQWLAGIKYGQAINDDLGYSDADAYTLVLGYRFAREVGVKGSSNFEFEFTDSYEASRNTGVAGDNWDLRSYGAYLTYQTPGTVYFKARLGLLHSEVRTEAPGSFKLSSVRDTNFAYGAGFGLVLGENQNINLELDWTAASGDDDISLVNLGGTVRF